MKGKKGFQKGNALGKGNSGRVRGEPSEEIREKQRLAAKRRKEKLGYVISPETRKKMTESRVRNGYVHSTETRKKMSGANCHFWKGGVTPINRALRVSNEYKIWRRAVFERDNYTCIWCGVRNEKGLGKTVTLNADHIKPFYLYPELRFAIDNGRTLCVPCHRTTETWGRPKKK